MPSKISIVTVSYNQGQYLEKTIQSVLNQNYPNLEYIIIDGGSSDDSVEIIKKYADRLKYWVSEPDKGQTDALKKGLKHCTGDIFNWLCSDDYLEPGALHKIAEAFECKTQPNIVAGKVREFNNSGTLDAIKGGTSIRDTLHETLVATFITQPTTYWRLSVFKEIGLNDSLHYFMDYEMWFRYLLKYGTGQVKLIDDLIAHYLFHESSKSQLESDYTQTIKSSRFKIDMNSIYHQYCQKIGYKEKLVPIQSLSTELVKAYSIGSFHRHNSFTEKQIINYYLFENAKRYYWQNDFKFALILFRQIEYKYLGNIDLELLSQMKFRSRHIKLLNSLRVIPGLKFIKQIIKK